MVREPRPSPAASLPNLVAAILPLVVLAAPAPPAALAQPAALVRDSVTTGVNLPPALLFGTLVVELDGVGYFFADDGVHGRELWRTDGTEDGTWMVRDVCPGQCTGPRSIELVPFQGFLYFCADDGVHGLELWRTDGTFEGTELVADAYPGSATSAPDWLTPFGDRLLFTARSEDGRELWTTDGTPAGSHQVVDIHPTGSSQPGSVVIWKGASWFVAGDGVHGRELWTSDGTAGGTHLVKDVRPGPQDGLQSDQSSLTRFYTPAPYGDVLLFRADDGAYGWELWSTDGTEVGTALLVDVEPGSASSYPTWLTPFAGEVFFLADQASTGQALWKTDGTLGGTSLVLDHEPGPGGRGSGPLVEAGGKLYFSASTAAEGTELWVSDGTGAGTHLVEDIDPGSPGALAWTFVFGLEPLGTKLLFQADDGVHGPEVWVTEGAPGDPQLLADLNPGAAPAFNLLYAPFLAGTLNGNALFFALDSDAGWELRTTGGVPGDVELVRDVDQQQSSILAYFLWLYTETADAEGTLFYIAQDPDHGLELWASDGTETGTRLVRDMRSGTDGSNVQDLVPLGDRLLFVGPGGVDGLDRWLWASDGTEGGTAPVAEASLQPRDPHDLTRFGATVYFSSGVSVGTDEVWMSDGTEAGTHPYPGGVPLPTIWELAAADSHLFIATFSELWSTEGPPAALQKLADVSPRALAPAGRLVFFVGDDGTSGREPWVSDGTPGGTHRILDLAPGPEGSMSSNGGFMLPYPDGPGIAGLASPPSAFFVADDGVHGPELWWSDGTEPGTRFLGDLRPGALGSEPRYLTVVGAIAYFVADDGIHGAELWRSDGTEAGTYLLADLEPGPTGSVPDSLTAVYGDLFFSAWRSSDGRELWRSDGTAAGTVRLQDVHPGAGSSSPGYFTVSGDRLFFTASDGERGFELWALDAVAPSLAGTKTVSGDLRAGGRAVYTILLHNPGGFDQRDNPGDELVDELPAGLTVAAATADAGLVEVDPDLRTVRWNGSVSAGGTVTLTIEAAVALGLDGAVVSNQAQIAYDGDGTGDNETLAVTDDPSADGAEDPTAFVVGAPLVLEVPTLGAARLVLLALLLAGAGLFLVRRV